MRPGTVLTRAYCMGSMHGAVCAPSRAMLLTGRSLFRVKENLAGQATWPEAFAAAGYTTFATGKWHNQAGSLLRSFRRGESLFLGGMGDPYALPLQDITPGHTLTPKRPSGTHSVEKFADAAVAFLEGQTGAAPFLCYVAFNAPHDPRKAPASYHQRYADDPPPLPSNFLPEHPFDNGELTIRDEQLAPGRAPPRSSAGTSPTTMRRSRSSTPRSAASSTRSTPADRRRIRWSSSPATTAWPSAAMASSASRTSMIIRCTRR